MMFNTPPAIAESILQIRLARDGGYFSGLVIGNGVFVIGISLLQFLVFRIFFWKQKKTPEIGKKFSRRFWEKMFLDSKVQNTILFSLLVLLEPTLATSLMMLFVPSFSRQPPLVSLAMKLSCLFISLILGALCGLIFPLVRSL